MTQDTDATKRQITLGYARVSTRGQSTENQVALLSQHCDEVFDDPAVSGLKNHRSKTRAELSKRVKELRSQGYPVKVIVTKLDRWGRSTKAVLEALEELVSEGASFETLDGGLKYQAGNAHDELVITIFAALAKFERELITSRMAEGRDAKVEKGLILGPRPALTDKKVAKIREQYEEGATDRELAEEWEVARSTIHRVLGIYGHSKPYISINQWEAAKKAASRKK